jgi:hypothetical protein
MYAIFLGSSTSTVANRPMHSSALVSRLFVKPSAQSIRKELSIPRFIPVVAATTLICSSSPSRELHKKVYVQGDSQIGSS